MNIMQCKQELIILVSVFAILVSCSGNKSGSKTSDTQCEDKFMQLRAVTPAADHIAYDMMTDTVNGKWHIRFRQMPNGEVISCDDYVFADNSLFVDIDYDGKKVVDCQEFRVKDFIPENDTISSYMIYASDIEQITDSLAAISFSCCIPDTDVGYFVVLNFDPDGKYSFLAKDVWSDYAYAYDPENDEAKIRKLWREYGDVINRCEYDSISLNKKEINPGYMETPDSTAYLREYYDNGNIAAEGWIVYFDDRESDTSDKVGIWKYYFPDGTMIEHEHSIVN